MRITIIGGTGHIGTYLVPRLVYAGHEVAVVSRGQRKPYQSNEAWQSVRIVNIDRDAADLEGSFGAQIRSLGSDVVLDLVCFKLDSAKQLVEALKNEIQLFVHCGTIWVRGYGVEVPAREDHPRNPLSEYGRQKNAIEQYLLGQSRLHSFPAIALHPGHIVGPGWAPVGPTACHDLSAIGRLLRGEKIVLPNLGMETLHHVHADDVAQAFELTLTHRSTALGEGFFIVSPAALTLRGFAEGLAARFNVQPDIDYQAMEPWLDTIPSDFVEGARSHISHCSNCSIEKARRLLSYAPRYSSLDAVEEATRWLIANQQIVI